jgi:hypothetical protein
MRVWRLVLTIPPLLHVLPVNRLVQRLEKQRPAYHSPPADSLARYVDDALHRLPGPWHWTCLKRASILYALLNRSGEPVQLHIGVKREADKTFAAHAWLVRDGQPYLEPPASAFATFRVITVFPERAIEPG